MGFYMYDVILFFHNLYFYVMSLGTKKINLATVKVLKINKQLIVDRELQFNVYL